ncbi:uncharacterized protein LOC108147759 isoform X2 [Drosophila elegans]|uniref:uncharacterized protein LOC108147759 isoform X2 n=1 Tax=Drosophila elegans TaxID=30023 RepID=UPI001BC8495D|nr:uncharacterized protein LOC108147759 isoform X2 [Drosophila elegans]
MTFTMTDRSLIRFESTKNEDEWNRTLVFFNVDISGRVCCDRQNEITTPRTLDCNEKRRNPGGGLDIPITESAMSFGSPNNFYAHTHDDFDHGLYKRRRRVNSAYFDNLRHFHYRTFKARRGIGEIESVSPYRSRNYADFHFSPDYESERVYENEYPDEYYEEAEFEPCRRIDLASECSEEEEAPRHYHKPNTYFKYESPYTTRHRKSHIPEPYERYHRHPKESYHIYKRDYRDPQSRSYEYRPIRMHRQTSGSLPPEYALNYNTQDYKEYKNRNIYPVPRGPVHIYEENYEEQPTKNYQNQYAQSNHYDYPEYYEQRKPFPKPQAKYERFVNQSSYKDLTDFSNYPSKMKYKRCEINYQPEKIPPRKSYNHHAETKEAAIEDDRISKVNLGLAPPKNYELHFNEPGERFYKQNTSQIASGKRYIHFTEEIPLRKNLINIQNEVLSPQMSLKTEPPKYLDKSDRHKNRSYRKCLADRKKSVDFVQFKDLNVGSEIPHRIRKSAKTQSSIFFTIEIPYKKKEHRPKSDYIPKRSYSGFETLASDLNSNLKTKEQTCHLDGDCTTHKLLTPEPSYYDVEHNRKCKTLRQKMSKILKKSKTCLKRSKSFNNNSCYHKEKPDSALNSPKTSKQSLEAENKNVPSNENVFQKDLSRMGNGCHYPTVFRGKSNQLPENDNEIYHKYSMYNVLSSTNHRSKVNNNDYDRGLSKRTSQYFRPIGDLYHGNGNSCKVSNRESSGNCSPRKSDGNPIKPSQINVCLTIQATDFSLTGSPRIVSSKVIRGHGLSSKSNDLIEKTDSNLEDEIGISPNLSLSTRSSDSTLRGGHENTFKNVRNPENTFFSTSNSSESISSRNQRTGTSENYIFNRESIEAISKPPDLNISRPPQNFCPRHLNSIKWSLTQKEPNRIEYNSFRSYGPGLCHPNKIEMFSRPPTLFQSDINKSSSLNETTFPKRVILKTNSSRSLISGSSLYSKENQDTGRKSECQKSQSHNFPINNDRKIEVPPRKISSLPEFALKMSPKSSKSKISKSSSGSSQSNNTRNKSRSLQKIQLTSNPDPNPKCSTQSTEDLAPKQSGIRGNLCCPKFIIDWDEESSCRRSFVEELKRELMESFRTEERIQSQRPFLRPTPHIKIFPYVPESTISQPSPNFNPNLFHRPKSVVCWAPFSKPQTYLLN